MEYILDITGRKREEERLERSERELATTFDSISCGLCIYQIEGSRVIPVFHNRVFYEIMGYSKENIQRVERETSYLNVHPEDLDALKQRIGVLLQKGGAMQDTYRV